MPRQKYPVQYPGRPEPARMTCSQPLAGVNRGCPAWLLCSEKTKGDHPVNVFFEDRASRERNWMHCCPWYQEGWHERSTVRPRIPRPETVKRVTYRYENEAAPWGHKGRMISQIVDLETPPEDLYGEAGSGVGLLTGGTPDLLALEREEEGAGRDPDPDFGTERLAEGVTATHGVERTAGDPVIVQSPRRR